MEVRYATVHELDDTTANEAHSFCMQQRRENRVGDVSACPHDAVSAYNRSVTQYPEHRRTRGFVA